MAGRKLPAKGTGTTDITVAVDPENGEDFQLVRIVSRKNITATPADVTNVDGVVLAANPDRRGITVQHISLAGDRVVLRFNAAADATPGAEVGHKALDPGASHSWFINVDTRALHAISVAGPNRLLIEEW